MGRGACERMGGDGHTCSGWGDWTGLGLDWIEADQRRSNAKRRRLEAKRRWRRLAEGDDCRVGDWKKRAGAQLIGGNCPSPDCSPSPAGRVRSRENDLPRLLSVLAVDWRVVVGQQLRVGRWTMDDDEDGYPTLEAEKVCCCNGLLKSPGWTIPLSQLLAPQSEPGVGPVKSQLASRANPAANSIKSGIGQDSECRMCRRQLGKQKKLIEFLRRLRPAECRPIYRARSSLLEPPAWAMAQHT
jgi:hypothetical protein